MGFKHKGAPSKSYLGRKKGIMLGNREASEKVNAR